MPSSDPHAEPAPERGGAHTYRGPIHWEYSPDLDHEPDPGEVVWSWVAYEEDDSIGKDRPIAVVGRTDDSRLVALMLSSQDHRGDRGWMSIGTGPWDREGRESWVRLDRFLAVESEAVRREGSIIPKDRFASILAGLQGTVPAASKPASKPTAAQPSVAQPASKGGLMARLKRLFGR